MKGIFFNLIPVFTLCILIYSCTYSPSEEIYQEIEPEISDIFLSFNNGSINDTLVVYGNTFFAIDMEFGDKELLATEILLNDSLLSNYLDYQNEQNGLALNTFEFDDGFYELKFIFILKSNTNSLADLLNSEALIIELERIIKIDNTVREFSEIIKTEIENGSLKYFWNRYNDNGFQNYHTNFSAPTLDQNDTSETVINYAGGQIELSVRMNVKDQEFESRVNYFDSLNVSVARSENAYEITWDQTPYFNNFINYEVRFLEKIRGSNISKIIIDDINQTSHSHQIERFPHSFNFEVLANSRRILDDYTIGTKYVNFPENIESILKLVNIGNNVLGLVAAIGDGKTSCIVYDFLNNSEIGSISGFVDLKYTGDFIFQYDQGSINKLRASDLVIIESFRIIDLPEIDDIFHISVSETDVLSIGAFIGETRRTYLFDWNTKSLLGTYNHAIVINHILSSSGRYLYWNTGALSGGTFIYDFENEDYQLYDDRYFIGESERMINNLDGNTYISDIYDSNQVGFSGNSDMYFLNSYSTEYFAAESNEAGHKMLIFNHNDGSLFKILNLVESFVLNSKFCVSDDYVFVVDNSSLRGKGMYIELISDL